MNSETIILHSEQDHPSNLQYENDMLIKIIRKLLIRINDQDRMINDLVDQVNGVRLSPHTMTPINKYGNKIYD